MPRRGVNSFYGRYVKRILDILFSLIALIGLSWLMLFGALMARFGVGKPTIFKQMRPGRYGEPFVLYKFHNMTEEADAEGKLLPTEQRITKAGRILRASSIDELPQLVNILKGEMSIIGPRPLLMEYLPRYTPYEMRRHEARPGLYCPSLDGEQFHTGDWFSQFSNDVWYVDNLTFVVDVKMVAKTFCTIFNKESNAVRSKNTREGLRAGENGGPVYSEDGRALEHTEKYGTQEVGGQ